MTAQAWYDRWQPFTHVLSSGAEVVMRRLPLTDEILRGTLSNPFLQVLLLGENEQEELYKQMQRQWQVYLSAAARALVSPRLVIERGEVPDPEQDEIGPEQLHYTELYEIYVHAVREVVPPVATAPFSPDAVPSEGTEPLAPSVDHVWDSSGGVPEARQPGYAVASVAN